MPRTDVPFAAEPWRNTATVPYSLMRTRLSCLVALVLFMFSEPIGSALGGPLTRYRLWQSEQATNAALKAFRNKRTEEAEINARRALQLNPLNLQALDLMAQLSAANSPHVSLTLRQRIAQLMPHSAEAWLNEAEAAIAADEFETAQNALQKVPVPEHGIRFFRDSGNLALGMNNRSEAMSFFTAAAQLPGAAPADRFNLDALALFSGGEEQVTAAREELERLAGDPALAVKSHRLLASYCITHQMPERAQGHIDYLLGLPQVQFEDVLLALDLFQASDPAKYTALLNNCFARFKGDALPASQLVRWLNEKSRLADARDSEAKVDRAVVLSPVYRAALADTFVRERDWTGLHEWSKGDPPWGVNEYLRIAYQLKARRELNTITVSEALNEWQRALAHADQHADWTAVLYQLALGWGWRTEAEKSLWAAADGTMAQRDALFLLWRWYERDKNTSGLFRVANRMLELNYSDRSARNNVVMLGSLLGINNHAFREWARENWENDDGKHPQFGTTYAFILYRQGNVADAVRVLDGIGPEAFQNPSDALYAGVIRAASGDREDARRLLEKASDADLLPEEKQLLVQSRSLLE
jgi:tetratricopeptide (TPR) repeat protein